MTKVRKALKADYLYWLAKDSWGPVEASILLAGFEPECFPDGTLDFSTLAEEVDGIHRLIIEDIKTGALSVTNSPTDWIAWLKQKLPSSLEAIQTHLPSPVVTEQLATTELTPCPAIKKEGFLLKRAALVKKYVATWPDIESDLNHASENGLSAAAKGTKHGDWFESAVLAWGDQRGKRVAKQETTAINSVFSLPGNKYTKS